MSAITPQTELRLIKCAIEEDNRNQINFATVTAQYNYFNSLPHLTVDSFTYQRADSIIRYPEHIDNILSYNYVMYQNEAYTNKWFYAFITKMEYVNDHMTNITIKTDVYQTWQHEIVYKKSFVEREHVNDDTQGLHTVPEQIETGEYICNESGSLYSSGNTTYIIVGATKEPSEIGFNVNKKYNGIFSGCQYLAFEDEIGASNYLRAMDELGIGDAVVNVFIAPTGVCGSLTFSVISIDVGDGRTITTKYAKIPKTDTSVLLATSSNITTPSTLDTYVPKNNKLFCFPYSYFYVSNNTGVDVDFKYEEFVNNTASFKTYGSITPGCSLRCVPINYKKLSDSGSSTNSFNAGVTGSKYPICSWNTDLYRNWATQNTLNTTFHAVGAFVGVVGGAALVATGVGVGVGVGLIGSGVGLAASSLREYYQHSFVPPQAQGNTNSGDITFSTSKMNIPYFKMSIRKEYAEIIDNYFSAYGYKVNAFKVPNVTGRLNWNYVKTIDCNIEGDIPESDIQELKKIFNNGVTFWHNPSNYLDYTQANTIVT